MSRSDQFAALYKQHRIDDQKRFYQARRDEYRAAHRQAIRVRNFLFALSAVSGVAGQLAEGSTRSGMGVLAATLAGLAGVVAAYDSLIGFQTVGQIYDDALKSLSAAEEEWDSADDLSTRLDRVEQVLRTENGQWGQLAVQQARALGDNHAPLQSLGGLS